MVNKRKNEDNQDDKFKERLTDDKNIENGKTTTKTHYSERTSYSSVSSLFPGEYSLGKDDSDELQRSLNDPDQRDLDPNIEEELKKTREVLRRQKIMICGLIIGLTIGQLICYLSVETFEDAKIAMINAAKVGIPIFILASIFYSGIFFFKLENKWDSLSRFMKGLVLSAIVGLSTVFTLVLIPPLFGDINPDHAIAIGLAINIIVDVIIYTLEGFGERFWKKIGLG
ncbi:MAG: hypothetical protein RMJ55_18905 [Roseiflexaceae bacterium]|nr:hypothetical protein [Roseiflexaceae bacterium]